MGRGLRAEDKRRGLRVEKHKHPFKNEKLQKYFGDYYFVYICRL